MKKIGLLICLFLSAIAFIPNSYAINYYSSVKFKASFAEEINLDSIDQIEIAYVDQTNYTKYLILTKENNFESTLENVPVGEINVEYGIVNNDTIGYYNVSADIYDNYDNTIDVIVNINLQNNQKNEELAEEIKNELSTSNNSGSFKETTTNSSENDPIDVSEGNTTKTTTTIRNELEEQEEIRKQEEKKAANRKKSNIVGIIMFSIIGITLFVAIVYATIKISKANK